MSGHRIPSTNNTRSELQHVSRIYWDIWRQKHRVRNPISYWSQYDLRKLSFWTFPGWNFNFLIVDKRNLTLQLKFEHFRNATAIIKGRYIVTFQIYLRLNKMVWTDVFHSLLISNCLFSIVGLSKVTCSQKSSFFFKHANLIRLVISEKSSRLVQLKLVQDNAAVDRNWMWLFFGLHFKGIVLFP